VDDRPLVAERMSRQRSPKAASHPPTYADQRLDLRQTPCWLESATWMNLNLMGVIMGSSANAVHREPWNKGKIVG